MDGSVQVGQVERKRERKSEKERMNEGEKERESGGEKVVTLGMVHALTCEHLNDVTENNFNIS